MSYSMFSIVCIPFVYISHDQPLERLLIASITDNKHLLTSDGQRFLPWVKFQELCNFHICFIVFDVQIMLPKDGVHHYYVTNFKLQVGAMEQHVPLIMT